jgi:hypothetical protein
MSRTVRPTDQKTALPAFDDLLWDMPTSAAATKGWKFNQIGIRVSDLERSLAFYRDVLGLQEISRITSGVATVVFVGYPDGSPPDKVFSREGVLELMEVRRKVRVSQCIGNRCVSKR